METEEAKKFLDFYTNIIDNHRASFKYHLSETAVLDWFGKTVKGCKNIGVFFNTTSATCTHNFTNVRPVEKIGFRDTHTITHPNKETKVPECDTNIGDHTPPNPTPTTTTNRILEQGQGDGLHNCESPVKKSRLAVVDTDAPMKYLVAEGCLEFTGQSSKKLLRQTRWSRPCKLHIAYTQTSLDDATVYLMIYEGSMRCRRNLMKDFETAGNASSD